MSRRALIGCGLLGLALLGMPSAGFESRSSISPAPALARPAVPRAPSRPAPPLFNPVAGSSPPTADAVPRPGPSMVQRLVASRRAMLIAAHTCPLPPRHFPTVPTEADETVRELRYRYTLESRDGEDRVSQVTVIGTTIADPSVLACIERQLSRARWPSTAERAGEVRVEDRLTLGELSALRLAASDSGP